MKYSNGFVSLRLIPPLVPSVTRLS
jgi:hypothetical protein